MTARALVPLFAAAVALAMALTLACAGPEDVPSKVHDLRVLGIQTSPPELMASRCVRDLSDPAAQEVLATWAAQIDFTALILDPAGEGREISYELWACASVSDRTCSEPDERFLLVPRRTTTAGELRLQVAPAMLGVDLATGDVSRALLAKVLENDPYKGLGGIRVPLVLHVEAGDEEIYAQKLMVYSCNFFPRTPAYDGPTMTQNVLPALPGVTVQGETWEEGEVPLLEGRGPFEMEPLPFEDLQEPYVVPDFELEPLELEERWRVAWHTDLGEFSPNQTGGAAYGGEEVRHRVEWTPPRGAQEQDVRFWMVVRDGRGGSSWITRTAHWRP